MDYRKLNEVTRKDAYPLPRIDETLEALGGAKHFTTLDLISGYWQVVVEPDDCSKTAFTTPFGLYEFTVMPFGLSNAPATFQRVMEQVLAGLPWQVCLVYLDDIIVYGQTLDEHRENLRKVFQCIREAGLKLQPSRCSFLQPEVLYLGHIVTADGIRTDPTKTAVVKDWRVPRNTKDVRRFLGLASYYRRFVPGFATLAAPLHKVSTKTSLFTWDKHCQTAFEELRHRLTTTPVLTYPRFDSPFLVDTDASNHGLGAVLSQVENGKERVVVYASRVLSKAERNYCATRKELLAVVYAVEQFRPYLYGQQFLLRTDHGALQWLCNFKSPEGQLARWLEKLSEFQFRIQHRHGTSHTNADALSRRPCPSPDCPECQDSQTTTTKEQQFSSPWILSLATMPASEGVWTPTWSNEEIRKLQLADPQSKKILEHKDRHLGQPDQDDITAEGQAARRLWEQWQQLEVHQGTLYLKMESDNHTQPFLRLVLPRCLVPVVLEQLHDSPTAGHLGVQKTAERVKTRFYWPGWYQDVQDWCQSCSTCSQSKNPPRNRPASMQMTRSGRPMQRIALDIQVGFPVTDGGNRCILVVSDYFTRWAEAYALPNQEATTVARKLVDEFVCRHGVPESLHSDQGANFESKLFTEMCKILGIHKTRTTAYHPQSDGLVERHNATISSMLRTYVYSCQKNWDHYLPLIRLAYNTSVHPSTGQTPFRMMYGREARLPIDIMFGPAEPQESCSPEKYMGELKQSLERVYALVREKTGVTQHRQKELYNRKVHGHPFKEGDLVWLFVPQVPRGRSKELHRFWQGPFQVKKKISDVVYRIQQNGSHGRWSRKVVHFNRLKPCHTRKQPTVPVPGDTSQPSTAPTPASQPQTNEPPNWPRSVLQPSDDDAEEVEEHSHNDLSAEAPETTLPRRSGRQRRPPDRFSPSDYS